jgi:catechol 2,3-dioxygenase-like lactoylglutathione lyase family enzyme
MAQVHEVSALKRSYELVNLDHVVLWVSDLERSKRFYINVLGMKLLRERLGPDTGNENPRDPDYRSFVGFGSNRIGLFQRPDITHSGESRLSHFAIMVEAVSLDAIRTYLESQGVVVVGRENNPDHPCLYVSDPDGHRVQLINAPER